MPAVGGHPTVAAIATAPSLWRPAPHHRRPQLPRRDRLHGPHLHPMAPAACQGARLRVGIHRLAPAGPVGQGRRVRPAPPRSPRSAEPDRPAGLVAGQRGHHERARQARGDQVGANPVDRGKPGSKLHLVCDGGGLPPIRTPSRRRRQRPDKVDADKGYDSVANRAWLRRRGIRARIARRGVESSVRLGRHRWRVERALSWLSCRRRLEVRWDRDSGRWFAFVLVACAVVSFNRL
jgi:hypothetical protein